MTSHNSFVPSNHVGDRRGRARRWMLAVVVATFVATTAPALHALPRYALLTGTRCSACHYNSEGSSIRTELGYQLMNATGAFDLDSTALSWLMPPSSNTLLDGTLVVGLDTRLQIAKLGRPPNAQRMVIPMQVAPSIAYTPFDGLSIYGAYNAGPLRYGGQTAFDAAIQYQPSITAPSIRVGHIQPSIGLRYDDHTMFVRSDYAGTGAPIIAPNYNEYGGEITYEGQRWLTVNVGVFSAHNLSQADPTVDPSKPSIAARVMLWPQLLDEGINGEIGASIYTNDKFRMINAFAGIGLSDQATLQGELMMATNADERHVKNYAIMAGYQLYPWLTATARYEHGNSTTPFSTGNSMAYVIGAEFFPIPLFELRPEYRLLKTDGFTLGQYALQFRVFY